MVATKYIIQKDNGAFYWEDSSSTSFWGLHKELGDAYLFQTKIEAERKIEVRYLQNCQVREVELKLI